MMITSLKNSWNKFCMSIITASNKLSGKYKFFGKLDNIIYQLQEMQILINLRIFYSNFNTLLI